MKEENILDELAPLPRPKINIWIVRLFLLLTVCIATLLPSLIDIFLESQFPNSDFVQIFVLLLIVTIGLFVFIKNTNYESSSVISILFLCLPIVLLGLILAFPINNVLFKFLFPSDYLVHWFPFGYTNSNFLEIFRLSFIFSICIPTGIFYWIKNKNRWLLPLINLILLFSF